jgi:hypothetical protein
LAILSGTSLTTGCIVHDHRPGRTVVVKEKRGGCPPAHHWNGRACVHNGKAKGHYK